MPQQSTNAVRTFYGWLTANIVLVFLCLFPAMAELGGAWKKDEYSHGPLIPLLAALIGWHRLAEKKPRLSPDSLGILFVFLGLACFIVSRLSVFPAFAFYGFVISLVGLSLAYFGRDVSKVLAPAFIYLVFAIPLPNLVYVNLSVQMQLISSTLGVLFIEIMGVPVFQDGNVIDLGGYKLQVAEACNGLRYLFPLMSFGFLVALLLDDKMWKRVVLFVSTIPITIFINALRIAVIGITVDHWGDEMAKGFLHEFEGWTMFLLCVFFLFIETWILMNIPAKDGTIGRFRYNYLGRAHGSLFTGSPSMNKSAWMTLVLCLPVALLLVSGVIDAREEIQPTRTSFISFPIKLGPWQGRTETLDSETLATLQLHDYFLASYTRDDDPSSVSLYMAYYASQRMGSSIHSPANCLPGSGWQTKNMSSVLISFGSQNFPVTRMLIQKGEAALLVYYWQEGRGRIINNPYQAKVYLLIDSIQLHRTDGALIRVTTPVIRGDEASADRKLREFLITAHPFFREFIPEKEP